MYVTARENKKNEGKVVLKMSSDENNTNVEKTEEAPPVPEFENPLANLILKKEDTHKRAESNKAFAHFRW